MQDSRIGSLIESSEHAGLKNRKLNRKQEHAENKE
jgi:hypothetical protein